MYFVRMTASTCVAGLLLIGAASAQERGLRPGEGAVEPPKGGDTGFYRASEIMGMSVKGRDGQELGQIQDLMIDRRSQQIAFFILGEGEELNAQSSVRIVPWTVARPHWGPAGPDRFVQVELEAQRFQQAPTFTLQQLQAPDRQTWATEVNKFYGVSGRPGGRGGVDVDVDRDDDARRPGRNRPGARPGERPGADVEVDGDNVEIEGRNRPGTARPGDRPDANARPRTGDVEIDADDAKVRPRADGTIDVQPEAGKADAEVEVEPKND